MYVYALRGCQVAQCDGAIQSPESSVEDRSRCGGCGAAQDEESNRRTNWGLISGVFPMCVKNLEYTAMFEVLGGWLTQLK